MGFYSKNSSLIGVGQIDTKIGVFDMIAAQVAGDFLFPFSSFTFTNAGLQGRYGPSLATLQTAYSSQPWATNTNFFTLGAYSGYQKWMVPATGSYTIRAAGASAIAGGRGIIIESSITLFAGEWIIICVGQQPYKSTSCGGGGGSFVIRESGNVPLIIAGGGGGIYSSITNSAVSDAASTTSGVSGGGETNGGTNGNGGTAPVNNSPYGGSGGGFLSAGAAAVNNSIGGGLGFNAGLVGGGSNNGDTYAAGGFGGGGGTHGNTGGGGGGGGYSGGGGQGHIDPGGGGGGSYCINSFTTIGYNPIGVGYPGYVTITKV